MIDVTHQISAVQRQVGTRTLAAGEARVVVISQTYDAAVEDVWDACTNPERIRRWFLPVSGELKPGGRYQIEGNAGGTVERCDRPASFFVTWEFGDQVSWVEVRLTAVAPDRTRLEIEHIGHASDEMWAQFGPGAVGIGWDSMILGLSLHLAGRPAMDPAAGAAWAASEEGRRFMTLSGERWCEAHIAGGGDESEARAMSGRAIAAYTTPPAEDPS